MGQTFGRQLLGVKEPNALTVLANLEDVDWKVGGITLDWSVVDVVAGSDVTLIDGNVVAVGQKALRYGQVLTKITSGGNAGMYGPYDAGANDGRQTLTRDGFCIMPVTVLENGVLVGLPNGPTAHPPGMFVGGLVRKERLIAGSQTSELGTPAGPSFSDLEAVATELQYV